MIIVIFCVSCKWSIYTCRWIAVKVCSCLFVCGNPEQYKSVAGHAPRLQHRPFKRSEFIWDYLCRNITNAIINYLLIFVRYYTKSESEKQLTVSAGCSEISRGTNFLWLSLGNWDVLADALLSVRRSNSPTHFHGSKEVRPETVPWKVRIIINHSPKNCRNMNPFASVFQKLFLIRYFNLTWCIN